MLITGLHVLDAKHFDRDFHLTISVIRPGAYTRPAITDHNDIQTSDRNFYIDRVAHICFHESCHVKYLPGTINIDHLQTKDKLAQLLVAHT